MTTNEETAIKLVETEQRARSNTRRIDNLEKNNEVLNKIATAVELLAQKQQSIAESVDKLDFKVGTLEAKPGKRWETVITTALIALIGALIGWSLGGI